MVHASWILKRTTPAETNESQNSNGGVISSGDDSVQNVIYTEPTMTTSQTYGDNQFSTLVDQIDETYSIKKILEMPSRISTWQFKTDSLTLFDSPLPRFTLDFPKDALTTSKKQKFYNFAYTKFDVKLKFLVSAPKTTSGIFWICYSPYEKQLESRYKIENRDIAGVTQYPGVKLNLAESTSAELVIPYVDYREAYNILSDSDSSVTLNVYLLAPIRNVTTSSQNITMTVEASLTNISLTCPVNLLPAENSIWKMQGLGEGGRRGVISEATGMISGIANTVSNIPVVGAIAKPVGFVSDLVGGVASLLGFSKPITFEQQQNVSNLPGRGYAHSKGVDNSVMLGMSQETELALVTDEFPSKEDEMDIDTILRTPGLANTSEWVDGETYTIWHVPFLFKWEDTGNDQVQKLTNTSYFEYLAMMFKYFRADIVYTFEISKTAFHAGKLELYYCSGTNGYSSTDPSTTYRVVWDISESNTLTFKIPFTYNKAFMPVAVDNSEYGSLIIRNVTPLMYNEGVEGKVDILCWKHYENVNFMCPSPNYVQFSSTSPTPNEPNDGQTYKAAGTLIYDLFRGNITGYRYNEDQTLNIWFDSEGGNHHIIKFDEETTALINRPTEFGKTRYYDSTVQYGATMDDTIIVIINLIELVIYDALFVPPAANWRSQILIEEEGNKYSVSTLETSQNSISVLTQVGGEIVKNLRYITRSHRPTQLFDLAANQQISLNFYSNDNIIEVDTLTYFSYMYRMMRGGIRYKVFNTSRQGYSFSALSDSIKPGLISNLTYNDLNPVHEVEVPYYNQNRRFIVGLEQPRDVPQGAVYATSETSPGTLITQAGSDDFTFGLRVGPPKIFRLKNAPEVKTPKVRPFTTLNPAVGSNACRRSVPLPRIEEERTPTA
ncbi:hypothetical protein 2 [Hubei picorna-like virus 25]|uniref:hypothetical protein 2 n=1 Tax=Hubei picorna-like virus 25 TaxID=1923105 RepID=UPI00090A3A32|nr:hypothetical protein 2 [Hubei picorna-like virus 25]APG77993.1 hypothetical protein 2 [Hubei picorna-like virus 25]